MQLMCEILVFLICDFPHGYFKIFHEGMRFKNENEDPMIKI